MKGIILIAKKKDSFKKFYEEFKKWLLSLGLPTADEIKKKIEEGLDKQK